jgi:hypothetical protein
MRIAPWHLQTNRFTFAFYLGFDVADRIYDTGDAWADMRAAFKGA